jgi:hypothetical protein
MFTFPNLASNYVNLELLQSGPLADIVMIAKDFLGILAH